MARDDLEPFQHRAGRGGGQIAEGVAHKAFEADHAARDQVFEIGEIFLAQQAVKPVIDMRLGGGERMLLRKLDLARRRRIDVGHFEYGRHTAHRGGGGPRLPIFFVCVAGLAEMHMRVDGAGQDMHAGRVERFRRRRHRRIVADGEDLAVLDGEAAFAHAVGIDERAVAQDDVGGDGHCRFLGFF